ncbi:MAG: undecaprenyl-phosphate glucose phosphotransferase [Candidatus Omnitrophica bacterium]|nr:undecaprenyl-phosphate glucose phosphotransferase [Candidatus Omnitrophota bacterium]
MAKQKRGYFFITALIISDALGVALAFLLAYWFRFSGLLFRVMDVPSLAAYLKAMIFVVPIFLLTFRSYQLYADFVTKRRFDIVLRVVKATVVATLILMAMTFIFRREEFDYSRLVVGIGLGIVIVIVNVFRCILDRVERHRLKRMGERIKMLLLGINRESRYIIENTRKNARREVIVEGILSETPIKRGSHLLGAPILGTLRDYERVLKEKDIDDVVVTIPHLDRKQVEELMLVAESHLADFKVIGDLYGMVTRCVGVSYLGNVPFIGLRELPLERAWNRLIKRVMDTIISSFAIIISLPLILPIAVAIWLEDGGPVFFTQERVGRDDHKFRLIKFRTMRPDAEKRTGPVWAKENDDRCTRLGRVLRRLNLDEVPQLWNVLVGDMSLVGPRPERPHFVEKFKGEIPRYMSRHKIKSGITGWAQVNGLRGDTSLAERIKYDIYYMESWSIAFDIKILFLTFFAFRNAY